MSRVHEILDEREIFSVEGHESVADVARKMTDLHVGAILVLNGGQLSGVFSERDLMKRVVVERRDPTSTPVSEVMTTSVVTIDQQATVDEAMEAMQNHNCRHLPVTCGQRVVGFLSMRDLMGYELERRTEELTHMRAYIGSA